LGQQRADPALRLRPFGRVHSLKQGHDEYQSDARRVAESCFIEMEDRSRRPRDPQRYSTVLMQRTLHYIFLAVWLLTVAGCEHQSKRIDETRRHLKFAISRMDDVNPEVVAPYRAALASLDADPIVAPYACEVRERDGVTTIAVQWLDPDQIVSEFLISFGDDKVLAVVQPGGFGSPVPCIHCDDSFVVTTPTVSSQYRGGMPTIKLSDDRLLQLIASSKNNSATICAILDGKQSNTCPVVHSDAFVDMAATQ